MKTFTGEAVLSDAKENKIPDFVQKDGYPYGVLSVGIHRCNEDQLVDHFVTPFAESSTRQKIASGFLKLKEEARELSIEATHWANGSFVTSKLDPGDIDVVHIVNADDINDAPENQQQFLMEVLDGGKNTKHTHETDSYLVIRIPSGQPGHEESEQSIQYWKDFWGHTRPFSPSPGELPVQVPKGFLELRTLCEKKSDNSEEEKHE